jgi:hypothetical protein
MAGMLRSGSCEPAAGLGRAAGRRAEVRREAGRSRAGAAGARAALQGEKDATSAQKFGQIQPFCSCIPTRMHGPICIVWANLTPFSLKLRKAGRCEHVIDYYTGFELAEVPHLPQYICVRRALCSAAHRSCVVIDCQLSGRHNRTAGRSVLLGHGAGGPGDAARDVRRRPPARALLGRSEGAVSAPLPRAAVPARRGPPARTD